MLHVPSYPSCTLTFVQVEDSKEEPAAIDVDTPSTDGEQPSIDALDETSKDSGPAMESTEETKNSDDSTTVPEVAVEEAESSSSSDNKEAESVKEDDATLPQPSEPEAPESAGQEESAAIDEATVTPLDSGVSSDPAVSICSTKFS